MIKREPFKITYFSDKLWICLRDIVNDNLSDQLKYELWYNLNDQLTDEIWKNVRYNVYQDISNYSRNLDK